MIAERGRVTDLERFSQFAHKAFAVIDWLPARFTAGAFAVWGFRKRGRLLANAGSKRPDPRSAPFFRAGPGDRSQAGMPVAWRKNP